MAFTVTRIIFVILGIVGTFLALHFATSIVLGEGLKLTLSYAIPMAVSWLFAAVFFFAGKKKKILLVIIVKTLSYLLSCSVF